MLPNIVVFENEPSTFTVRAKGIQRFHDSVTIRWPNNNMWSFVVAIKIAFAFGFPLRHFEDIYPHLTRTSIYRYIFFLITRHRNYILLQNLPVFIFHMTDESITIVLEFSDMTS